MAHKLDEYIAEIGIKDVKADDVLEHTGVKGMKWGVRKGTLSGKMKPRATLSLVDRWESKFIDNAQTTSYSRVYRKAARKIRGATRALNRSPKFKGQSFVKDSPLRREYYKAYSDMVTNQLNAAVTKRRFLNPLMKQGQSFTRKFELHFQPFDATKELRPRALIRRTDTFLGKFAVNKAANATRRIGKFKKDLKKQFAAEKQVAHSGMNNEEVDPGVEVTFQWDENGYITDLIFPGEEAFAHMMDFNDEFLSHLDSEGEEGEDFFKHWGIKGMRWGFRKRTEGITKLDSKPANVITDEDLKTRISRIELEKKYQALSRAEGQAPSNADLQEKIARIELEKKYNELTHPKMTAGKRILTGLLVGAATTVASKYLQEYMTKGANKLLGKKDASQTIVDAATSAFSSTGWSDAFRKAASGSRSSGPTVVDAVWRERPSPTTPEVIKRLSHKPILLLGNK
jgi:hypothetical protein